MHILKHLMLLLPIMILTGCGGSDSTKEPIKPVEQPQEQNQTTQNHETNNPSSETNSTTTVIENNNSTENNTTTFTESNNTQVNSEDEYEDIYLSENGYYDTQGNYHSNDEVSTPVSKSFSDKTFYVVDKNESDSGSINHVIFTHDMSKFFIQYIVGEGDSEKWEWNITSYTDRSFYIEDKEDNNSFSVSKNTADYLEITEFTTNFEENSTNTYVDLFYFTREKARAYIDSLNNATALFAGKTLYVTDEVANSGKLLRISYNQTMQEEKIEDIVNEYEAIDDSIFVEGLHIFYHNSSKHIKLGEITDKYIKATYNREEIRFYFDEAKAKAHAGL